MQTALILSMDDAYTRHKQETLENNRLEAVFGRVKVVVQGTMGPREGSSFVTYQVAFLGLRGLGVW